MLEDYLNAGGIIIGTAQVANFNEDSTDVSASRNFDNLFAVDTTAYTGTVISFAENLGQQFYNNPNGASLRANLVSQFNMTVDAIISPEITLLYDIERQVKTLDPGQRQQIREEKARPTLDAFHQWLVAQRQQVPDGLAIARAIDYSLKRWIALTRYCDDGAVPIDNNWVENQIRPWALGRSNWLFAGSLHSGQRAAAVMSLIQSAKMNEHDPYAYLKDVLERLPTQRASAINELLSHNWVPDGNM